MKVLNQALYSLLKGHAAFGTLLADGTAGIYSPLAPQGAAWPFVTFHKQTNTPGYVNTGLAYENALYLVKAVDRSVSAGTAETIAAEITLALEDQTLAITGYHNAMFLRRESDVDMDEVVDGVEWCHRGALYRIMAQPG